MKSYMKSEVMGLEEANKEHLKRVDDFGFLIKSTGWWF